jgi:hypothetical protein
VARAGLEAETLTGGPPVLVAKAATTTIPIIFVVGDDIPPARFYGW